MRFPIEVEGTVENAPEGETWVTGCGQRFTPVRDGSFRVEPSEAPCVLRAARKDGVFVVFSDPIYIEEDDEVVDVDFVLPREVQGGMGIVFEPGQDGVLIDGLAPGGAAAEADLETGDIIVAIDGVSTAGMDMYDFLDYGLGNVGTEVALTVDSGGQQHQVVLVRREL
jgi:membrane-associated protease RseP (regulator of RpoE activity)